MPKMRAAQIARPNGPFELVEREIPAPAAGWVRIKVQACGICHSENISTGLAIAAILVAPKIGRCVSDPDTVTPGT